MAATEYSYSLAGDFPNGLAADAFEEEVASSGIDSAGYLHTNVAGDNVGVWFDGPLDAGDETLLDGVVAAHDGIPLDPVEAGMIVNPLGSPAAPTVAPQGTPGSTSWGYCVTAFSPTGETVASEETLISTGAATLGEVDFNRVSWGALPGAVSYAVFRTTAGGSPSYVGRIARTTGLHVDDVGLSASGGLPSEDRSGAVIVGGDVDVGGLPARKLDVRELTTDDSSATSLIGITRRSSEPVLAGFGTGVFVRLNDDDDVLRDVGSCHFVWSDPATAAPEADFRVLLRDGGTSTVERLRVTHRGDLELAGADVVSVGTCRVGFPVDTGIRGGGAAASSNNDVPSVTFAAAGESRLRWTCRPPQNRTGGDLTLRAVCSFAGTPGNTGVRWQLDWSLLSAGDALPASYQHSVAFTEDESARSNDVLFAVDFAIPAGDFDATKDFMALWLRRDGDHAGDTCTLVVHVHLAELRYTGRKLAGQPGQ